MTKEELAIRIWVAHEQLEKCHSDLCRSGARGRDDELIWAMQDAMIGLLNIQVMLGTLKREEDLYGI